MPQLNSKLYQWLGGLLLLVIAAFCYSPAQALDYHDLNNGQTKVIDEFTQCRVVTNNIGATLFIPTKTLAEWSAFYTNPPANVSAPACASCTLDGVTVLHGASRTFFLPYPNLSCYGTCAGISQVRSCYNGVLDGSASYDDATCPPKNCRSCTSQTVNWTDTPFTCSATATGAAHLATRSVSDGAAPSIGSASFRCNDSTWEKVSGSCGAANCSLPWGGTLAHSSSVTAYQTASLPCGGSCASQTRTCNNGSLSGSYGNASCSVAACASCNLPWGGTIAHNASVNAYSSTTVPCGSSCTSVRQTRTCNNGTLGGSYPNETCSVTPCSCNLPWGGTIANGASVNAYSTTSVPCGSSCTSVRQTRSCSNGTLSGSYTNASCSTAACASCARPWGGTVAHNSSITAYQSATVACGGSCNSQTRTCTNGSLSGSYVNSSCSVTGCASCSLDGATVAHNNSRTFYRSTRSCGQGCTAIDQVRTCNNGTLSGSSTYNKRNCPAESCANCSLDGTTVNHGSSKVFYQSTRACGQACTAIDQVRNCTNGTLDGSSSYSKKTCPAESGCGGTWSCNTDNTTLSVCFPGMMNGVSCSPIGQTASTSCDVYGVCMAYGGTSCGSPGTYITINCACN